MQHFVALCVTILGNSVIEDKVVEQMANIELITTTDGKCVSKEEEVNTVEDSHDCGKEKEATDKADDTAAP